MAVARRRRPLRPATVARIAFVGFWLLFLLIPLYWMFITSIKPSNDYLAVSPIWFPDERTLLHYTAALYAYRGLDGLINSLIISTSATILSAFFGTLMAYSLARFNTGGQHLSFWVLSQRFLPPIAVVLPIFLIYRVLRLNDTACRADHRLHGVHRAGLGLDDVRLFPANAGVAGGGGAGRRLHALAELLAGCCAARGPKAASGHDQPVEASL